MKEPGTIIRWRTRRFSSTTGPARRASFHHPSTRPHPRDFSTLTKNPDGSFTRTIKDGSETHFDPAGPQSSVTDRNGNVTTYEYDPSERLIRITDPVGLETTFTYVGNHLSTVTDPANRVTTFEHDPAGNLVRVIFPDGSTRSFGYDGRHLMASETDGRLNTTEREYDFAGLAEQATLPDGSVRTVTTEKRVGLVDPASGLGTEQNPAPLARPEDVFGTFTDSESRSWTVVSGPLGLAAQITDPAGLLTEYERNTNGSVTETTLPSGHTISRTYDAKGNVLTLTDETLGATTTFTYEPASNQVETITDEEEQRTTIEYTEGNPTRITTPGGRISELTYDARGLLETVTDPLGTVTRFTYDAASGNLLTILQGENLAPSLQRETHITRTLEGYPDLVTDSAGEVSDTDYDLVGRVTLETLPRSRIVDYDPNGNLTSLTPPGRPDHGFTYTPVDLEEEYTPPAPEPPLADPSTRHSYNAAQQLTQTLRPDGVTITYGYDTAGRLSTITLQPSGETYTSTYDPLTGQLTSITGPGTQSVSFTYLGELLSTETWSGPVPGTVTRTYDVLGRIDSQTVNAGTPVVFEYDADGLLTRAGDLLVTRAAATGLIQSTTLGVVADAWTFNAFGELDTYSATVSSTAAYSADYERDKLGRITSKTETIEGVGPTVFEYGYDAAGRLEQVIEDGVVTSTYTYNQNGNRLSRATPSGTISATHDDQDRLLTYGDATYTYTENGDLESKTTPAGVTTYGYDAFGNLRTVILPDATTIEYVVDGRNRRVGKKVNGTLVQGFLYQDQLNPVAELDGAGNVEAEFVYGEKPNVPEYMVRGGTTYRLISDHLGSVRLVVDVTTGTIAQRIDYDEFGNVLQDTNPGFQPFGFAGGIYDTDTGLVRFGARDYDPETGRWTAKDPIRFNGGDTNLYGYVIDDPINLRDSGGLDPALTLAEKIVVGILGCWRAIGPVPVHIEGLGVVKPVPGVGPLI